MSEKRMITLLLIEDEEFDVRRVRNTIAPFSHRIQIKEVTAAGRSALALLAEKKDFFDVVIMDFQIAGGPTGESLISAIKKLDATLPIIVVTKMTMNVADYQFAERLMQAGAFWYCTKYPGDIEAYIYQPTDFILSILNAYQQRVLAKEQDRAHQKISRNIDAILAQKPILGSSPLMQTLREKIHKYAGAAAPVLITGPSGTGKENAAYHLHYHSPRRFESLVVINCGALPEHLVESELFGYEKGAFTGADSNKSGLFEVANHGSIFLDEINELPLTAQAKLLRVLQEGEIDKIGRKGEIRVDVRVLAATNKSLKQEVEAKRFRADLYYRLNVVELTMPPLRSHKEDVAELLDYFIRQFCAETTREPMEVTAEARALLREYDWPGNIRELKSIVRRLLLNGDAVLDAEQVRLALGQMPEDGSVNDAGFFDFERQRTLLPLRQMERLLREEYFRFVRDRSISDTEAAKKLGLAPSNYYRMCKELGLK